MHKLKIKLQKYDKIFSSISISLITIIVFLFATFQVKVSEKIFYKTTFAFTKISSYNISTILSEYNRNDIFFNTTYKPYTFMEYKNYENPEIFVITEQFINLLHDNKSIKYRSDYSTNMDLAIKVNKVLDSFISLEHVKVAYLIDKSGYMAFVSHNYRGFITNDITSNIINVIYPNMTISYLKSNHVGNSLYKINDINMNYTMYPIVLNEQTWGNLVVVFDNEYFKKYKNNYMQSASILCIIVICLFGIIFYVVRRK